LEDNVQNEAESQTCGERERESRPFCPPAKVVVEVVAVAVAVLVAAAATEINTPHLDSRRKHSLIDPSGLMQSVLSCSMANIYFISLPPTLYIIFCFGSMVAYAF